MVEAATAVKGPSIPLVEPQKARLLIHSSNRRRTFLVVRHAEAEVEGREGHGAAADAEEAGEEPAGGAGG